MQTNWKILIALTIYAAFALFVIYGFICFEETQFYLNYTSDEPISQNTQNFALVSAYTLSSDETDDRPCETASGLNLCSVDLIKNRYVACPREYDFGQKFEIAGEIWECQDRMHKRYANRFDLLMPTKEMAFNWGVREIQINKINEENIQG